MAQLYGGAKLVDESDEREWRGRVACGMMMVMIGWAKRGE